jgi:hypothetical protein
LLELVTAFSLGKWLALEPILTERPHIFDSLSNKLSVTVTLVLQMVSDSWQKVRELQELLILKGR